MSSADNDIHDPTVCSRTTWCIPEHPIPAQPHACQQRPRGHGCSNPSWAARHPATIAAFGHLSTRPASPVFRQPVRGGRQSHAPVWPPRHIGATSTCGLCDGLFAWLCIVVIVLRMYSFMLSSYVLLLPVVHDQNKWAGSLFPPFNLGHTVCV